MEEEVMGLAEEDGGRSLKMYGMLTGNHHPYSLRILVYLMIYDSG